MMIEPNQNRRNFILIIIIILLISGATFYLVAQYLYPTRIEVPADNVVCTQDAKICPDGSAVGRVAPDCEFAPCSDLIDYDDWEDFSDQSQGVYFKYPKSLTTNYIKVNDWPPSVEVQDGPYNCEDAGNINSRAGEITERIINGHTYCVTEIREGATGSVYVQYSYAAPADDKVYVFNFTLQEVQCDNYNEAEKIECQEERNSFNIDSIMDEIIGTLRVEQ